MEFYRTIKKLMAHATSYQLLKAYVGLLVSNPIMPHKLPIMNSPKTNPRKSGKALRYNLMPPYLRIIHLAVQLMKNGNQSFSK